MKLGTVYAIRNTVTNRQYIGQTMTGALTRWGAHRQRLGYGRHSTKPLQADWNATGEEAFVLTELETGIDPERLGERELFWMKATVAAGIELYNQIAAEICRGCGAALETTVHTNSRRQFCPWPAPCWRYAKYGTPDPVRSAEARERWYRNRRHRPAAAEQRPDGSRQEGEE